MKKLIAALFAFLGIIGISYSSFASSCIKCKTNPEKECTRVLLGDNEVHIFHGEQESCEEEVEIA
jgi:hypothetical protein